MEDICKQAFETLNKDLDTHTTRLNSHSKEIDLIKLDIMAQKKDTTHLQEAIKSLKVSIDLLIKEIGNLKMKPLQRYEQVITVVITLVIGFIFGKVVN